MTTEPHIFDRVFRITYTDRNGTTSERSAIILCGSPPYVMTIIDLDKRRIRHLSEGGVSSMVDVATGEECPTSVYWDATSTFPYDPYIYYTQPQSMALAIRRQLVSQISLMLLIAEAAEIARDQALDQIVEYSKRECRFAVSDGEVPYGRKQGAWPILRDLVTILRPRREHVEAYVKSLWDDQYNGRRINVFNEAMMRLAMTNGTMEGARLARMKSLSLEINEFGRR